MSEWWSSLTYVNQIFFGAAAFFSVFFVWQLIAAFIGLGGDHGDVSGMGGDVHDVSHDFGGAHDASHMSHDVTYDKFEHGAQTDADATQISFQILSVRSIITFFTLFTWGTALYLSDQMPIYAAMGYSILWGLAGMFSVALIFFLVKKMTEVGTMNLSTAIGETGTVYLNIPQGGLGEVRVSVSGNITYVKARGAGGKELKAGTPVRVTRRIDATTVEVEPIG
jgi:hypothetical protein